VFFKFIYPVIPIFEVLNTPLASTESSIFLSFVSFLNVKHAPVDAAVKNPGLSKLKRLPLY
jgi:hypothetical protein